jgi:ferrous iron transport protein B
MAGVYLQQIVALIADYIFVNLPTSILNSMGAHEFLIFLLADSVGAAISLVLQFVPVIGALYLLLSILEETGYISRAAFLLDRFMSVIAMSGKSFLPLVTGFGCNVPSIVATRFIENKKE